MGAGCWETGGPDCETGAACALGESEVGRGGAHNVPAEITESKTASSEFVPPLFAAVATAEAADVEALGPDNCLTALSSNCLEEPI